MCPYTSRKHRSLGKAYQFVKRERSRQKNGLEAHVEAFDKLVSILRSVGHGGMDAKELGTSQKEIQD